MITTSRDVAGWGEIIGDTTVAAAMLDRLLHRSVVLNFDGDGYRLRDHHGRDRVSYRLLRRTGHGHHLRGLDQARITVGSFVANAPLAPMFGWTRADYERALQRDVVASALVVAPLPCGPVVALLGDVGARAPWQADALCNEHPEVDWFASTAAGKHARKRYASAVWCGPSARPRASTSTAPGAAPPRGNAQR